MRPKKLSLFYIGFCLYFAATFVSEIGGFEQSTVPYTLKMVSLLVFALSIVSRRRFTIKTICIFVPVFSLICVIALFTTNVHYVALLVIILASMKEEKEEILCYSYTLLIIGIGVVLMLTALGVLKNSITYRILGDNKPRYALGFNHSNVLPLMTFYLFSWRLVVRKRLNYVELGLLIVCTAVLYRICGSRNGLVLCCTLIIYAIYQNIKSSRNRKESLQDGWFSKLLYKYSVLLLAVLSIGMVFLYGSNPFKASALNELFSDRLSISYDVIQRTGIHLINFMPDEEYFELSKRVLDNGYVYTIVRYGIIFILFYIIVQVKIYNQHDNRLSFVFALSAIGCMIDNDFFSYGYLPFLLIAFQSVPMRNKRTEVRLEEKSCGQALSNYSTYRAWSRVR